MARKRMCLVAIPAAVCGAMALTLLALYRDSMIGGHLEVTDVRYVDTVTITKDGRVALGNIVATPVFTEPAKNGALVQVGRDRVGPFTHNEVVLHAVVFDNIGAVRAVYCEGPVSRNGAAMWRLAQAFVRVDDVEQPSGVEVNCGTRTIYYIDDWISLAPHLLPFGDRSVWYASRNRGFVWGLELDKQLKPVKVILAVWPRRTEKHVAGCLCVTYTMSGDSENWSRLRAEFARLFGDASDQMPPEYADMAVVARLQESIKHLEPSILAALKE